MRIERVPLSALPDHFRPLAAAFAEGDPRLQGRFPISWRDDEALKTVARSAAKRGIDPAVLSRLDAGPALDKLKAGAAAVVTGQQPSVALGPMYNVYKAISAIRWARRLDAVPVFWNHSDDDHLEGLNRVATPEGAIEAPWSGEGALFARKAALDLDALEALLPGKSEILRRSVKGDVAGDFTRLLKELFGDELLVVEPRHLDGPRAQEIFRRALADPALVQRAVDAGGAKLKDLGFERTLGHSLGSNVYAFDGSRRVRAGEAEGRLSAGVALRLIVQDAVLPTALVVAGPNEVAYIAQLRELYEAFGRTGPVVAPRITATIVDPRAARIAGALGIKGVDLLTGKKKPPVDSQAVAAVDSIASDLERRFDALEADPHARDATPRTREKIHTILSAYRERIVAAAQQADGVGTERARKLSALLTPEGKLQERVFPVWYFLPIAGPDFVRQLTDELDPFSADHQIVWM